MKWRDPYKDLHPVSATKVRDTLKDKHFFFFPFIWHAFLKNLRRKDVKQIILEMTHLGIIWILKVIYKCKRFLINTIESTYSFLGFILYPSLTRNPRHLKENLLSAYFVEYWNRVYFISTFIIVCSHVFEMTLECTYSLETDHDVLPLLK